MDSTTLETACRASGMVESAIPDGVGGPVEEGQKAAVRGKCRF
jgi:hypothetical protein